MSKKKKIHKPVPVSGFPEWLPEIRRAEQLWFDQIRTTFERYGFCNIETPSVETLDVINAKGSDGGADVDKEVYVLERLHKEEGDKEARLALHFDQTVPLARYTAQHFNNLIFPFKRYQIQRVWRGERPQSGRFREFYQCDIDVINVDDLPLHFDAEMPAIIWEILSSLPGMEDEKIQIRISNRKILLGLLDSWSIEDKTEVLRIVDKIEKVGPEETYKRLEDATEGIHDLITRIAMIKAYSAEDFKLQIEPIKKECITNQSFDEGIEELAFVMDQLSHFPDGAVVADLSIVRGLDYYTGTVYETVFLDDPSYGSICSGGRYDDLASNYINKKLPGVGISIGFSRLFERIRMQGKLPELGVSPATVMVACENEDQYSQMMQIAQDLRSNNINVETYHKPTKKIDRVLKHADKKKIPYVWFAQFGEIKNMATGEQTKADPSTWRPET